MGLAENYARALKALLPRGRLWRLDPDGTISRILLANGDEMARVDGRVFDVIEEADPRTTDELLPDFERVYGLAGTGTEAQRRALVVSRVVRQQRFRPEDFRQVLAPVLGLAPVDVVVIEQSHAFAVSIGDAREIFRFFIYRNPSLPGTFDLDEAQRIIDQMKPSHTLGQAISSVNFLCDDPASLCDRDRLGV